MALAVTSASAQQGTSAMPKAPTTAEAQAKIAERFKAADADHDGKLTREEAKVGMPGVYDHFDKIDRKKKGYATEKEIGSYWGAMTKDQMKKETPLWFGS